MGHILLADGGRVDASGDQEVEMSRAGGNQLLPHLAEFAVVAALYFALAKGSLAFASINPSATPIWPPTGLALALTLLRGRRILPAIFVGAAAANVATAGTIATSLVIAIGNTLEAFVGAWLMRRWAHGGNALQTPTDIGKFAIIVAGASTPISAFVGVTALSIAGFAAWESYTEIWATWWLGNATGGIMVTPAILLWARSTWNPQPAGYRPSEFVFVVLLAATIGAVALGPLLPPSSGRNALAFLAVLPLLWAALRGGRRDTATVALVLSAFAIWGAAEGGGPFVQPTLNASLLLLGSFIATATLPSLALSAAVMSSERALAKSERDYHRLVDSVRDYAIFMLDPEGRVTTWNPGAERIKGYAPEEIIGRHFRCFYSEEDRERHVPERALATAAETGRFEAEGWRLRKDGTRFRANVVISAIHDEQHQLVGFTKVTRDVTERHEAQAALDQTREKLHQAQKLEALGRLTGGVAHDFNNLLMAISGGVNLLASGKAERRAAVLNEMRHAVERAAGLTRQLLAFGRRETLHPQSVDVAERLSAMRALLKRSVGAEHDLDLRFPSDLSPIDVDPGQFEMAILNLAINARDAMPAGGTITISAENVLETPKGGEPRQNFVRIDVHDTGSGMTPEVQARAFEPFYSTKGPGRGTGLGLSQVHGFAEQSGGSVAIESGPEHGTTVTLILPQALERPTSTPAPPEPVAATGAGNILVVEDDDRVASVVCEMIEDLGYRATRIANAALALGALERTGPFDLVFSDIAMPGAMNGTQLAATIRERWPSLPILLTTGYSTATDYVDAPFRVLQKPYGVAELSDAFRDALLAPEKGRP
jgi:PAS domain S-box-containing protein